MADKAIPGTEDMMSEISKWKSVNTTEFSDVGKSLQNAAEQAGASHKKLQTTLSNLSAAWQGKSAESYRGYMESFSAASKAAQELLREGVKSVQDAVRELDRAQREMQAAVDGMQKAWDQKLPTLKGPGGGAPSQQQVTQAGHEIAGQYKEKVNRAVQDAQQAMQKLSQELSQHTSQLKETYSSVPSPGTAPASAGGLNSTPVSYSDGGGSSVGGGSAGSGGGGGLGSSGAAPAGKPPGNVNQWIDQAIKVLQQNGIKVSEADKQNIWAIIQHESAGNPHAINNWDSNAAKGTPSKGLMQCIDPTFQQYKLPGHDDIWNPVDNICAGVKYSISRYGSLSNVPGVKAVSHGGGYVGY